MYVDDKGAEAETGIPVATLRTRRTRGGGPPFYKIGRSVRYDLDELRAWVRQHRVVSTTDADQTYRGPHRPHRKQTPRTTAAPGE